MAMTEKEKEKLAKMRHELRRMLRILENADQLLELIVALDSETPDPRVDPAEGIDGISG